MMQADDPRLHAYLAQLAEAHGFTLEQLAANRGRHIHPAQARKGKAEGTGIAVFFVVLSVLLLAGGIGGAALLYDDLRPPISQVDMNAVYAIAAGGVLLSGGALAGAIALFRRARRRTQIYEGRQLEVLEGPIHKTHIWGGGVNQYVYDISGHRFYVMEKAWQLVTHGARYRVYTCAGDLLSLEPA